MAVKTLTSEQVKKCFSPPSLLKPIKPMMKELKIILNRVGMTWFLDGGSILGALRHSSVLPFDDDIDIGVLHDELESKKPMLKTELKQHGYYLRPGFGGRWTIDVPGYGEIIPFYQIFPTKPKKKALLKQTGFSREEIKQLIDVEDVNFPYGDLFPLVKPEEEKEYRIIGGDDLANMGKIRLSDEELRYMSSVKVFGESYPVPYNPLKYLKEEYSPHLKPYYAVVWADHREVDPICKEKRHIKDVRNIDSIQAYLEALFPGDTIKAGFFTDGKTGKKFTYQSNGSRRYIKK